MPTTYWDLRRILDVNPEEDRLCVGFAPSKGRRCKNPINQYDRPAAGRLLDQMDRSTHLLDTIKDLEMLATLLLCKGVHIKPQHSQVRVVYGKWERRVTEEHLRLRERAEREAERETERIAEHVAGAERADAERLAERVAEISRRVERMVEQIAEAERVDEERLAARVAERDAERTTAADVMSEVEEEIQKVVRYLDDNMYFKSLTLHCCRCVPPDRY
ncbi:hypothetical protein N431DRAFT_324519 [Stipitochalara longipes BDJ]|nr:hypothetical protein N431DRAFT_324519 [Stipitochalara longipes BDJ]